MPLVPNTFGLKCEVRELICVSEITSRLSKPWFILGSCSNSVLPESIDATCIKITSQKVVKLSETKSHFIIKAGGGYNWHSFVELCLQNNWHGLENLIFIPGTLGAAPVQNIGAYGCEVADKINKVYTIHLPTLTRHEFYPHECEFAYRSSIFKKKLTDHIITEVEFKLDKQFKRIISHPNLQKLHNADAVTISTQIKMIRNQKLPNPQKVGNAGSFFKNPIVDHSIDIPNIPSFIINSKQIKLSAAALIEQANLKGLTEGGAAISNQHALVIVNLGKATYSDIKTLASRVQNIIYEKHLIKLEPEVQFITPEHWQQP